MNVHTFSKHLHHQSPITVIIALYFSIVRVYFPCNNVTARVRNSVKCGLQLSKQGAIDDGLVPLRINKSQLIKLP